MVNVWKVKRRTIFVTLQGWTQMVVTKRTRITDHTATLIEHIRYIPTTLTSNLLCR